MHKLNNKGQTLIMFVILIPIILFMMALVIDISYVTKEKSKLENITEMIIKDAYKNNNEDIYNNAKDLYKVNKISTANLEISKNDNEIIIKNKYDVESIFGKVIGLKKYEISTTMRGINENNNIKILKE